MVLLLLDSTSTPDCGLDQIKVLCQVLISDCDGVLEKAEQLVFGQVISNMSICHDIPRDTNLVHYPGTGPFYSLTNVNKLIIAHRIQVCLPSKRRGNEECIHY